MIRQNEESRFPMFSGAFKQLNVTATLKAHPTWYIRVTNVLLSTVVVTRCFLWFGSFSGLCHAIHHARSANRAGPIVINARVPREVCIHSKVNVNMKAVFIGCQMKKEDNCHRTVREVSAKYAFLIRLLVRLQRRRIHSNLTSFTSLLLRIGTSKMPFRQ